MLIVGDDVTDEDMFRAAPDGAITVHVGGGRTAARMRLSGPDQVRKLLGELVEHLDLRVHPGRGAAPEEDEPGSTREPDRPAAVGRGDPVG